MTSNTKKERISSWRNPTSTTEHTSDTQSSIFCRKKKKKTATGRSSYAIETVRLWLSNPLLPIPIWKFLLVTGRPGCEYITSRERVISFRARAPVFPLVYIMNSENWRQKKGILTYVVDGDVAGPGEGLDGRHFLQDEPIELCVCAARAWRAWQMGFSLLSNRHHFSSRDKFRSASHHRDWIVFFKK